MQIELFKQQSSFIQEEVFNKTDFFWLIVRSSDLPTLYLLFSEMIIFIKMMGRYVGRYLRKLLFW